MKKVSSMILILAIGIGSSALAGTNKSMAKRFNQNDPNMSKSTVECSKRSGVDRKSKQSYASNSSRSTTRKDNSVK